MRGGLQYVMGIALAVCVITEASAQKSGLSVSLGGASFKMEDMKYLMDNILDSYPAEGAIISSFPPYYSGSVNFIRQFYPHLRAGAGYSFTSTGARANYTDYSGDIATDMSALSHRLGASVNYSLITSDRLDLSLYGRLDANYTTLDVNTSIYVLGLSNTINHKYSSISPTGSSGLELLYKFKESAVGIEGGYLVDFSGKLKNRETGNDLLDPNDSQRVLTSDWTGWRVGIKGIIWLK